MSVSLSAAFCLILLAGALIGVHGAAHFGICAEPHDSKASSARNQYELPLQCACLPD